MAIDGPLGRGERSVVVWEEDGVEGGCEGIYGARRTQLDQGQCSFFFSLSHFGKAPNQDPASQAQAATADARPDATGPEGCRL